MNNVRHSLCWVNLHAITRTSFNQFLDPFQLNNCVCTTRKRTGDHKSAAPDFSPMDIDCGVYCVFIAVKLFLCFPKTGRMIAYLKKVVYTMIMFIYRSLVKRYTAFPRNWVLVFPRMRSIKTIHLELNVYKL